MTDWLDVSSTATRIAYVATAGQTVFVVPFTFLDEDHLVVSINDVTKTLSTHYATSGAGEEGGGTVTLVTGATLSDSVVIELAVPYELTTHIPTSGDLDIPAINLQFSLFIMMLKQLVADQSRSIRQPSTDVDDLDALPIAASRASKYLAFDADGQPTVLASVSTSVAATAYMVTLNSTANDAAEARTLLGITDQSSYTGLSNWHFCR
jgi:hypothetical protein